MTKAKAIFIVVNLAFYAVAFASGWVGAGACEADAFVDPIEPAAPVIEEAQPVEVVDVPPAVVEPVERWSPEVVAIARACVNETEFATADPERHLNDCGAIAQVAIWHSEHHGQYQHEPLRAIQRLSRKSYDRSRTDGRSWIAWMNTDLTRPQGYYRSVTWSPEAWEAILDRVAGHFDGSIPFPCSEPVFHWGGPVVDGDRIAAGKANNYWHEVDCGPTLNTFLAPNSVIARVARGAETR